MITNNDIWANFFALSEMFFDREYDTHKCCECCEFWDIDICSDKAEFLCLNKESDYYNMLVRYNFSCKNYNIG